MGALRIMALQIRKATLEDLDLVARLDAETTWASTSELERRGVDPSALAERLREDGRRALEDPAAQLFVAEDARGQPLGVLWMEVRPNPKTHAPEGWILLVAVEASARGRGAGSALLAHAEEVARTAGAGTLGLMVARHNERAVELYLRLGFTITDLVMRRALAPPDTGAREEL